MTKLTGILRWSGVQVLLFVLGCVLFGGPIVIMADRSLGQSLFAFLFVAWGGVMRF